MKTNPRDVASSGFWLALSIFVCWLSLGLGLGSARSPGPGLFIFLSSSLMGLLSVVLCLIGLMADETGQGIIGLWKGKRWGTTWLVVCALVAYALLLSYLGFILTTFLIMTLLFRLTEVRRWWVCGATALLVTLISYMTFDRFLGVPLPRGILDLAAF